eukprot:symbB.v1.2.032518.t1/scaffold3906.1/size48473/2
MNPAHKDLIADDRDTCCLPLCKHYTCPEGWLADPAQQDKPGKSEASCCTQECALFDHLCPANTAVKPKRRCEQGRNVEQCCDKKCSAHKCDHGWKINVSALHQFGNTSEVCCSPTCARFDCDAEDGWLYMPREKALAKGGVDPETCCFPACSRYSCGKGYVPNPQAWCAKALSKTGDEACCLKTCEGHKCGKGFVIKTNSSDLVGHTDQACCEPEKCIAVRANMTQTDEGCHAVSEEDCNSSYFKFGENASATVVQCSYDKKLKLCRNKGIHTVGCQFE